MTRSRFLILAAIAGLTSPALAELGPSLPYGPPPTRPAQLIPTKPRAATPTRRGAIAPLKPATVQGRQGTLARSKPTAQRKSTGADMRNATAAVQARTAARNAAAAKALAPRPALARPAPTLVALNTTAPRHAVAAPAAAAVAESEPALPPEQAWPRAVDAFVKSLVSGELDEPHPALTADATIRTFDGTRREALWRLAERADKATVVGRHAYLQTPLVLAADVAADFKSSHAVDDRTRAAFVVDDESDMKRANATATAWVIESLSINDPSPVGVIVLWPARPGTPAKATTRSTVDAREPLFILVRGEQTASHTYKINTVIFGDPAAPEPKK
jgi:hypothetical protein